ncbi:RNA-directed DNA polymerase from mobile element jockey [Trichonephila clavipes]|nr:RNA-directed DNA polymerase from mobile element jockey [Trichonephila clavipes]
MPSLDSKRKIHRGRFLDIQKAFDRILRRQSQRHSLLDKANKGGSAAGRTPFPTLFNIYINDIPKTRQTTVCLYADDTAILTQSANKNCITHFLHRHLAELEDWYKKWKISINPEKPKQSSSLQDTALTSHRQYTYKTTGPPGQIAASPLDERKVTLRSLKPTAFGHSMIRTVKERRTGSPVSPYPSRPAQLTYAAGSNPLRRASRQAPETSSHSTRQSNANILLPVPYTP